MSSIDDIIGQVADEMAAKHPPTANTPGSRFARQMQERTRDHDVRDRAARKGAPMRIIETPAVVMPDGWDIHEYGRKKP